MQEVTFPLQIERITQETPRVKTFRLRTEREDLPFRFSPGQHMGVHPLSPGKTSGQDPGQWRHFSLSSSPVNRRFVEITVLDQGMASAALHRLSPGDWVEVTRPMGGFTLEEPVDFGPVFFGAGIGVAPIRSMVRYCLDRNLGEAITLFLAFSSAEDGIFLDRFQAWAKETPRLELRVVLGEGGRLQDRDVLREDIRRPGERTCYLCLPPGLREKVQAALVTLGIPPERIRWEIW